MRKIEFSAGFVSAEAAKKNPRGVTAAAVESVAAEIAQTLAKLPSEFEWENEGRYALSISVLGALVDGLVLDSCLRVVASACRVVGLVESESQIVQVSASKAVTPSLADARMVCVLTRF